jgi:hypothetical protein
MNLHNEKPPVSECLTGGMKLFPNFLNSKLHARTPVKITQSRIFLQWINCG